MLCIDDFPGIIGMYGKAYTYQSIHTMYWDVFCLDLKLSLKQKQKLQLFQCSKPRELLLPLGFDSVFGLGRKLGPFSIMAPIPAERDRLEWLEFIFPGWLRNRSYHCPRGPRLWSSLPSQLHLVSSCSPTWSLGPPCKADTTGGQSSFFSSSPDDEIDQKPVLW